MTNFVHIQGGGLGCDKIYAGFSEEKPLRQTQKKPKKRDFLTFLTFFAPQNRKNGGGGLFGPQGGSQGGSPPVFSAKSDDFGCFCHFLAILGPPGHPRPLSGGVSRPPEAQNY